MSVIANPVRQPAAPAKPQSPLPGKQAALLDRQALATSHSRKVRTGPRHVLTVQKRAQKAREVPELGQWAAGLAWTLPTPAQPHVLSSGPSAGGSRGGLPEGQHACLQKALTATPTFCTCPGGVWGTSSPPSSTWNPRSTQKQTAPLSFCVLHWLLLSQVHQGGSLHLKTPDSEKEKNLCTLAPDHMTELCSKE